MSNNYRWSKIQDENNLPEIINKFLVIRRKIDKWDIQTPNFYAFLSAFIISIFWFFPFAGIIYYFLFTKKWLSIREFIKNNILLWCPIEDKYFWQYLLNSYKRINLITWIPVPGIFNFFYFYYKFYSVFSEGKKFSIRTINYDDLAALEKEYIVFSKDREKLRFFYIGCLDNYIIDLKKIIKNMNDENKDELF